MPVDYNSSKQQVVLGFPGIPRAGENNSLEGGKKKRQQKNRQQPVQPRQAAAIISSICYLVRAARSKEATQNTPTAPTRHPVPGRRRKTTTAAAAAQRGTIIGNTDDQGMSIRAWYRYHPTLYIPPYMIRYLHSTWPCFFGRFTISYDILYHIVLHRDT